MQGRTKTDASATRWQLNDDVILLRHWATERCHVMPRGSEELVIGSDESCWLRLEDERVSRKHATLRWTDGTWVLRDAGSRNGVLADGVKCREMVLEPGMEVRLGGVTLVAESGQSMALRAFLARLLGWASDCGRAVDLAVRSIRIATRRHAALVLCGEDDLVLLARALHLRVFGAVRPFIVCDPRRKRTGENVRAAANYQSGMEALRAAKHGSLCIWNRKLPSDFDEMKLTLADPDTRVQLVVCVTKPRDAEAFGAIPIAIPSLRERPHDLPRIVDEYAHEVTASLGVPRKSFSRSDQDWVVEHSSSSLPEIEKMILRLLRIREVGGDLTRAASLLGMDRWSLDKWVQRNKPPVPVEKSKKKSK